MLSSANNNAAPWFAEGRSPKVCVAIATRGRSEILAQMVRQLQRQSLQAAAIIIVGTSEHDLAGLRSNEQIILLKGKPGLAAQRNVAMANVPRDCDIIAFFDDDFIPDERWLDAVATVFDRHPSIDGVTGDVILDGINGRGVSVDQALRAIETHRLATADVIAYGYSPYGCNMAFRWSVARDLRFDERLVLYGWQEDRDFGAAVVRRGGQNVKIKSAFGVHLGAKTGRTSGRRLGYSQIVNPLYLVRKGSMTPANAALHIARNFSSNVVRSLAPEPHVDRLGRLGGNLLAIRDIAVGLAAPERAEQI